MKKNRCILCGKPFEDESLQPTPIDSDDDDEMEIKKPLSVCLRCQAKLKHEADESQKIPKPM